MSRRRGLSPSRIAVACLVTLLFACSACSSAKKEAAALVFAVDTYRRADNVDKIHRAATGN